MKRVTCFLLAILMLLGSTALADAPQISNVKYIHTAWGPDFNHNKWQTTLTFALNTDAQVTAYVYDADSNTKFTNMKVASTGDYAVDASVDAGTVGLQWQAVNPQGWHPAQGVTSNFDIRITAQNDDGSDSASQNFPYTWSHTIHTTDFIPDDEAPVIDDAEPEVTVPELTDEELEEILAAMATPAPKKETYMHNNIRSFGPQVKEINAELTEKWFRITPVDLSEDGLQVFDMISGEYFVIGYVTVLVDGDTVTVERVYTQKDCWDWKENNYYTFFADLDSVYSVEPNEIKDEDRMEYKREYSIEKDLNGDTDVLLYMCNKATHTDDGKKLTPFRPKDPQNAEIIQAMADHILGRDIK